MLEIVPSVPILGSFFPPLTGIPMPEKKFPHRFNPKMNARYGDFYRMKVPTFGKDIQEDLYVIADPFEMQKVVQSQPMTTIRNGSTTGMDDEEEEKYRFPVGVVEQQWPFYEYFSKRDTPAAYIFTRGQDWWESRQLLLTYLGTVTRSRMKSILCGAERGCQRLNPGKLNDGRFHRQLNRIAFDMLECVLFGSAETDEKNPNGINLSDRMFDSALTGMLGSQALRRSTIQTAARKLGITTLNAAECYKQLDHSVEAIRIRIENLEAKMKAGDLTPDEEESYVVQHLQKQRYVEEGSTGDDTTMSRDDLPYYCLVALLGGIDTTAGYLAWIVLQLSLHPNIQDDLYKEIREATSASSVDTANAIMDKIQMPWLYGVVRETHRVTPPVTVNLIKDCLSETTIHGMTLPPQSAVLFDSTTPQQYPRSFDPTKWFPSAVQARKDENKNSLVDHPYLAKPFGQGIRRCPGAALADAEVHAAIFTIVSNWEFRFSDSNAIPPYWEISSFLNTGPIPEFPSSIELKPRQPDH